ncbi:MAG TPA: metallophosphoesterase [Microvirga sp.]|jgi:predicted MPP superfamily phosphohydrolase
MMTWPSRRAILKTLFGSAVATLGLSAYAFGLEPAYRLRVQRYAITPPRWPQGLHLTIAVIADPHVGEPYMPLARVEETVAAANALGADLIVLLGDYAAGHRFVTRPVSLGDFARAASHLAAPLGVYAILGNHDWWDDPEAQRTRSGPVEGRRVLEAVGIPVLENDAVRLVKDGQPFWLLGLGDQLAFPGRRHEGVDDLPGTLARLDDDSPAILLAHEPDIFPQVPERVALTLSGHTHGGQVRLFGYSPVVPSRFGNRYAYGHIVEGGRHLVVSGGLGTSIMPVRLGIPPEIVLVELGTASGTTS